MHLPSSTSSKFVRNKSATNLLDVLVATREDYVTVPTRAHLGRRLMCLFSLPSGMCQHEVESVRRATRAITVCFTGTSPGAKKVYASTVRYGADRTLRSPSCATTESWWRCSPTLRQTHVVELANAPTLSLREALHH